jgi:hypothetical protein
MNRKIQLFTILLRSITVLTAAAAAALQIEIPKLINCLSIPQ